MNNQDPNANNTQPVQSEVPPVVPQQTSPSAVPYTPAASVPIQGQSQGLGIASLVLSIASLLLALIWPIALPLAIAAIVCGVLSIKKLNGKGMGIAGLVLGILSLLIAGLFVAITLIAYNGIQERARETSKQMEDAQARQQKEAAAVQGTSTWDYEAAYNKVTEGMTKADAEAAIVEKADHCSMSEISSVKTEYCTYGALGADHYMAVTYTDGKVTSKSKY